MSNIPMFLRPNQVESEIGISTKLLNELKDTIFKQGIHYFIPDGLKYAMWDRDALLSWMKGSSKSEVDIIVDDILNKK